MASDGARGSITPPDIVPHDGQGNVQDIVAGIQSLLTKLLEQHQQEIHALTSSRHAKLITPMGPALPLKEDLDVQSFVASETTNEAAEILDVPDERASEVPSAFHEQLLDMRMVPVKFSVYTLSLPNTCLDRGIDLAKQHCQIMFRGGKQDQATTREIAFQPRTLNPTLEPTLPGEVPSGEFVMADWTAGTDVGMDCFMHVPEPCPTRFALEVWCSGSNVPVAEGFVRVGEQRQQVGLTGGGILDVEVMAIKPTMDSPIRDKQVRQNIRSRLETVLAEQHQAQVIMARDLIAAVKKCGKSEASGFSYSLEEKEVEDAILELRHIFQMYVLKVNKKGLTKSKTPTHVIAFHQFLKCMFLEDVHMYARDEEVQLTLFIIQRAMLGADMPSAGTSRALLLANQKRKEQRDRPSMQKLLIDTMTALSTAAIITSVAASGISMDIAVGEPGWVVLDTLCSAVFLVEVIAKLYVLKPRQYFCGPAGAWNVFDVVLTGAAVLETVLSFAAGNGGSQSRVAMMLRGLRIARLARVAKLMRMPLLQELATIVSGFFISLRPLFWVLLTLFLVVYFIAVLLRATLEGFRVARSCGDDGTGSEECPFHLEQGHLYCTDVLGCMFSVFRCIIGDCTTHGGESLVMVFSDGFGMGFDLIYAFAMVVVTFGLFNIITAIFVEATLKGLKASDRQQKFARAHQSGWMTQQLARFVELATQEVMNGRMRRTNQGHEVMSPLMGRISSLGLTMAATTSTEKVLAEELFVTEEEFLRLIRKTEVQQLLCDMDINVEPREGILAAFVTEEDGSVSMSEIVSGLMRFRGDLHKIDMAIARSELENLQRQVAKVMQHIENHA